MQSKQTNKQGFKILLKKYFVSMNETKQKAEFLYLFDKYMQKKIRGKTR